jgi:hypothetical protein
MLVSRSLPMITGYIAFTPPSPSPPSRDPALASPLQTAIDLHPVHSWVSIVAASPPALWCAYIRRRGFGHRPS